MKANSFNKIDDSLLEQAIRNILSKGSLLFPTNETELNELLAQLENDKSNLPKELEDFSRIFRESEKRYLKSSASVGQIEDYALAARNGGKISREQVEKILNKIKPDSLDDHSQTK